MDDKYGLVSDFLLTLYSDAADCHPDAFRVRTLKRLQGLLDFDFAVWGGGTAQGRRVTDLVTFEQSARVLQDWSGVADQDAFCDITLRHLGQTGRFDDIEGYRDTVAYNEHWKTFGARQMMATISAEPLDGYVSFVGLCSDTNADVFCDRARMMKAMLMPHLSSALRINRETALLRHAGESKSVGLVDQGGWVLIAPDPFTDLVRREWGVSARLPENGLIVLLRGKAWQGRAIAARAQKLGGHYLVRLTALGAFAGLTPRERQVTRFYVSGLDFREIARELGVAPSTVRNHISNIFEKLDVGSKTELIQRHMDVFGSANAEGLDPHR
ncbi:helix-turn-helix transcriptional regulator [Microbaculum marinisediminis]|uniref:LuxR C-terminal-related transcriptional regulator n=1 Tax=Microbaculum marinisediminis TaxID=2931392 RepID=A0AAW5R361_9HYPH|nr:LuxR C-terminal-related transcriptional regulator [Microbaculum sp. A6E488]MCT8974685.1 LuxR C-terminal-related transcriptional regulator [Microbaculum sp. A6E488]